MLTLLRGAKRTTPLKTGLVYALLATSFLITADLALTAVGAPTWIFSLCLTTLSIAFPFVVLLSWAVSARPPAGVRPRPRPWLDPDPDRATDPTLHGRPVPAVRPRPVSRRTGRSR